MKPCIKFPIIFSAISLGVGGLAAIFTRENMDIYERINQPFFSPPSWVFPIVWAILYILMGIGAGLVWCAPRNADKKPAAIFYFGLQLVVNFFWSIIFFNLQMFKASFVWLVFLLALILLMVSAFAKVSKVAAYLQIPYIAWVFFAGILNLGIAILN
ncbi:MAG: tryptophan-rich sensory protein [Ruminococcus sp.]|nr:tryptophan-rich sensory protein [Ruminococcus sp.]